MILRHFREGWERFGLHDYFNKKVEIKRKLEEALKAEGKSLEDAVENVYVEAKDDDDENTQRSSSRYAYFTSF